MNAVGEETDDSARTVDVLVFYFDVANLISKFVENPSETLRKLRTFQRLARREFPFGYEHSYVATLYDNVWCRVNAAQPGLPSLLFNFAGSVMDAARQEGFVEFFGCITRGQHEYCPEDRILVGGESFDDLTEQHIDITSEPHIRAAYSEKWRPLMTVAPKNSVWVSSEVLAGSTLAAETGYADETFSAFDVQFDLSSCSRNGNPWPFAQSKFYAIGPRNA